MQAYSFGSGSFGATAGSWFGPLAPMRPLAPPDVEGRTWDYPTGYNLTTRTRAYEPVGFPLLRQLADGYDLLRIVIETRKDQLARMSWSIKNRDPKAADKNDMRVAALKSFFQRPDGRTGWHDWLRSLLEDLFVIDAPALYAQRQRDGQLYRLVQLDGATIKPVIDDWGQVPFDPLPDGSYLPAYQQILKGLPAVDYSVRQLLYRPRNRRAGHAYGFSPVEQIITTVNIALRRQLTTLEYFTSGNMPDSLIGVPETWTPDQITAFQRNWDAMLTGDLAARRRAKFVPGGVAKTFVPTREPELKNDFDEWLSKLICFTFSISPQALIKQMNRASGETQKELAEEEGLSPLLLWLKAWFDDIIEFEFGAPDLEFSWDDDEVDEGQVGAFITGLINIGAITRNEGRDRLGLDPLPDPEASQAMITTGSGAVPLSAFEAQQEQARIQAEAMASRPVVAAQELRGEGNGDDRGQVVKYSPDQPRDVGGRWSSGGGALRTVWDTTTRYYGYVSSIATSVALTYSIANMMNGFLNARVTINDPRDDVRHVRQSRVEAVESIFSSIKKDIVPEQLGKFSAYLAAEKAEWAKTTNADPKGAALRMANAIRHTAAGVVHDSVVHAIGHYRSSQEKVPYPDVATVEAAEERAAQIKLDRAATKRLQSSTSTFINGLFRTAISHRKAAVTGVHEDDLPKVLCPTTGIILGYVLDDIAEQIGADDSGDLAGILNDVDKTMHSEIDAEASLHKYSDAQPRDASGRWTSDGGSAPGEDGKPNGWSRFIPGTRAAVIGAAALTVASEVAFRRKVKYRDVLRHIGERDADKALQALHDKSLRQVLSDSEHKAVSNFVDSAHVGINKDLRLGRIPNATIADLDSAISKSKLPENTIVYRGLNADRAKRIIEAGSFVTDHGYTSTTISPDVAMRYAGKKGYVVSINVDKDTNALPLDVSHSAVNDAEVILPRSSSYRILRVDHPSQTIYAEHVGVSLLKAVPSRKDDLEASNKLAWHVSDLIITPPALDDTTGDDYADYVPPQPADVAKTFNPSQPRDAEGQWTDDGGGSSGSVADRDFADARSAAKKIAIGAALTATAAVATILAPEIFAVAGGVAAGQAAAAAGASAADAVAATAAAGRLAWVTGQVKGIATGMYIDAGLKGASIILRHLGIDAEQIQSELKPIEDAVLKASALDGAKGRKLRDALCGMAEHGRDALVHHLQPYNDAENYDEAVGEIDEALDEYKAKIKALGKVAKRSMGGYRRQVPFDRPATRRAEKGIAERLGRAFEAVGRDVVEKLKDRLGKLAKADPDPSEEDRARRLADEIASEFDFGPLHDTVDDTADDLGDVASDSVSSAVAQIGPSDAGDLVDQVNDRAVTAARDRAAEMVGMRWDDDGNLVPSRNPDMAITETTRDELRGMIADALAENVGADELASRISESFALSPERAALIAATEVSRANSEGALASYQGVADLGVTVFKAWITAPQGCCDVCAENAAKGPIDLDEDFPSGDATPPGHPNCRCSLSPVVGHDETDDGD